MLFFYGVALKKIATDLNMELSLIYRRKDRLKLFRTANPSPLNVQGRRRALNREYKKTIKNFLNKYPQTYLDKIAAFIYNEFDLNIHNSTLSRAVSRIQLIYKRVEPVSNAQDEELRIS